MAYFKHAGRKDNCCEDCKAEGPCEPCDGPPVVCSLNPTLNLVISGLTDCFCVDQGGGVWRSTTITGVNGMHTVTLSGSSWFVDAGSITINDYGSNSCGGSPSSKTRNLRIFVLCNSSEGYRCFIRSIPPASDVEVMYTAPGALGAALINTYSCATGSSTTSSGDGGTATITE